MATVGPVTVVHYDIDDELHRRVKAAAAREGITLKAAVEQALREWAERVEKT